MRSATSPPVQLSAVASVNWRSVEFAADDFFESLRVRRIDVCADRERGALQQFFQALLRGFGVRRPNPEMNFDVAGRGEHGRLHVRSTRCKSARCADPLPIPASPRRAIGGDAAGHSGRGAQDAFRLRSRTSRAIRAAGRARESRGARPLRAAIRARCRARFRESSRPSGTIAWRLLISAILRPNFRKRSSIPRSTAGFSSRRRPSSCATASRVRSSSVGPRPPLEMTISTRSSASRKALRISSSSSLTTVLRGLRCRGD